MSIDLICYANVNVDETNKIIELILLDHPEIFPKVYHLFYAKNILNSPMKIAIAEEFGLIKPKCSFLINLIDKSLPIGTKKIARLLYQYFNENNLIVTFGNDYVIKNLN